MGDNTVHIEAECPTDRRCGWKTAAALVLLVVGAGATLGSFLAGWWTAAATAA